MLFLADIQSHVIQTVDASKYYQDTFPGWSPTRRDNVRCPFHSDEGRPNLSIGLKNGGARCHRCEKRIGNIVQFEAEARNVSEKDAARTLYAKYVRPIFPARELDRLIRFRVPKIEGWIASDCGLTHETCHRFDLGLDPKTYRVAIPIQDRFGNTTNVRYYQLPRHRSASTKAKIYNADGYGYLELFPWREIKRYTPRKPLFMMKAETDTMLAIQMGLQAFCVTNGELSWNDEWTEMFEGFEIGICLDPDAAGRQAAERKFDILQQCKSVVDMLMPFKRKSTQLKDFKDWILKDGGTKEAFLELYEKLKSPKVTTKTPPSEARLKLPEYFSDGYHNLIDVGRNPEMMNRIVRIKGIISAKTDKTYTVPYKFLIGSSSSPKREWTIPMGRELLRLIRTPDDQVIDFIKQDLLKHKGKLSIEPLDYVTITEVEVIPLATTDSDAPYVTQRCFAVGRFIEANIPYELEIIPTTEIRTQETIGIIVKVKSITSTIEEFVFDKKVTQELDGFRAEPGSVWEELCNVANEVSSQFTRIYNRLDWHIVALLSWACPLQFEFPNEGIQRGWLNTLALGDTQTGKSQVTDALHKLFNCGAVINAENCTYVGLVGGAVKMGSGQFMLRWGRIPLCNKQLVVIEELSGLSINEISNMSEVRSSGVARLDKGGLSSQTSARTRLICLSNVRGRDRDLASSASGVRAVQELIGHGEDIARFDLIVTLVDTEVSSDVINTDLSNQNQFESLNAEKMRLLIQFIWALKPEQIHFTREAYLECLKGTKELALKYHSSVPIFKAGSGRLKLARIALAIAAFQFSWNDKIKKIQVNDEHVQAAIALLQMLYDKDSLGYRRYSEEMQWRDHTQNIGSLESEFRAVLTSKQKQIEVLQYLAHAGQFTRDELCQVASIQIIQADRVIGRMIASNLLRKGVANVWEITHIGRDWIRKHIIALPSISSKSAPMKSSTPSRSLSSNSKITKAMNGSHSSENTSSTHKWRHSN